MKHYLREERKMTDMLPLSYLLTLTLFFVGSTISGLFLYGAQVMSALLPSDAYREFLFYFAFIGIWVAYFLFVCIPKHNRPMLKTLSPQAKGNNMKAILIGALLGFGCNAFCIFMSMLNGDLYVRFDRFEVLPLLLILLAVLIQSGAEELLSRSYLYQKLRRRYRHPAIAIIGNAAFFMLLHLSNAGVTLLGLLQIFTVGVVFSLIVYYYDSLWCAIMFHTFWNYTQNIIFGLPNSGLVALYSLCKLEAASARNGFFYNVNFGVEGSIGALIVLMIVGVIIIITGMKRHTREDLWSNTPSYDECHS